MTVHELEKVPCFKKGAALAAPFLCNKRGSHLNVKTNLIEIGVQDFGGKSVSRGDSKGAEGGPASESEHLEG
ncbi:MULTISPECIES: hypothetical protein [Peribacillus]|uniref:hypothetical protein n=1 Tax=Peribacillus TaxID=2675229 RepID=UPI001F4DA5AE|nr:MULTISPECIES: hypothetical protein [unclassified Peribacillus]MCK1986231.1 hypothetical protein [Peribacillus sp. Aquil_B1]MCK2010411.1 hypothetical protein [Peribacillus sp. Aquil_B8]